MATRDRRGLRSDISAYSEGGRLAGEEEVAHNVALQGPYHDRPEAEFRPARRTPRVWQAPELGAPQQAGAGRRVGHKRPDVFALVPGTSLAQIRHVREVVPASAGAKLAFTNARFSSAKALV
jgi:hypothetical protein